MIGLDLHLNVNRSTGELLVMSSKNDGQLSCHMSVQTSRPSRWMRTQVDFTLSTYNNEQNIMDDKTVFEAADFLKMQIRDKKLHLTDLNGQLLMTANVAYGSMEGNSLDISLVILILLSIILFMIAVLVLILAYFARRIAKIANGSSNIRNKWYCQQLDNLETTVQEKKLEMLNKERHYTVSWLYQATC
ncbi:hypothetical protein TNCV_3085191 [Trichonephila clavipes]|nr:hypothetical protein TNCV_3085191 [Trichonephila clavipes]